MLTKTSQLRAHVALTQVAPRGPRLAQTLRGLAPDYEWRALPSGLVQVLLQPSHRSMLEAAHWLVLTSPSTIEAVLALWGPGILQGRNILVVGPGSVAALRAGGVHANILAPPAAPFDARHAVDTLLALPGQAQSKVLVLGGESSRVPWQNWLASRVLQVDVVAALRLQASPWTEHDLAWLHSCSSSPAAFGWVVSSVQAAHDLDQRLRQAQDGLSTWGKAQRTAAIHPAIAAALLQCNWAHVDSIAPGEAALVAWARRLG